MRVFTGSLSTETNTFSPLPTGLEAFRDRDYYPAGQHPDRMVFAAGPLWALREHAPAAGWTVIEGLVASAQPAGITTRVAYETLRDMLLDDLKAALPVDMVLLGLHGAMVADGYDDCEGDLLARVRQMVGPDVGVGATLDPHCHLTPLMAEAADLLILFKEYPHTDALDRARELVRLMAARQAGAIKPAFAMVDCEMVVPIHTTREPGEGLVRRMQAMEAQAGVLSVSTAQGFATGDVPEMGVKTLVYTDGDAALAQSLARGLADEVIGCRDALLVRYTPVEAALDEAVAATAFPVVLADRADNPGSGAPGDSTYVLAAILARGLQDVALGPLWDPGAVAIAFSAGIGARLPMRIGGKTGPLSGTPVDAEVEVLALNENLAATGNAGVRLALGPVALVRVGGVELLLTAKRTQALNVDFFTGMGCDLKAKKIVVVKSAQHFYRSYATIAARTIYVGAPGVASGDWSGLPYRKIRQPKWPIS